MSLAGAIEDRLAIADLYGKYSTTASRCDRDGWLACWSDEAIWKSHIFVCNGKQEIARQYDEIMTAFDNLFFLSQPGPITFDGDTARVPSNATEIARFKTGGFFKLGGIYEDTFQRIGGAWFFARRDYQPLVQDF